MNQRFSVSTTSKLQRLRILHQQVQMHAASPRHQLAVELFCFVSDEAAAAAGSRSSVSVSVCKLDCPNKTALLQHARSLRQLWSNWPNFNGAAAVAPSTEISLELRHLFAVTSSGDSIVYDEGNGPTGSDPFHLNHLHLVPAHSLPSSTFSLVVQCAPTGLIAVQTGNATQ